MTTITLTLYEDGAVDEDGEVTNERTLELPALFEVCERCSGTGKHVNPSIDSHGIGREEFDQDPDFEEAYFSGAYDVTCSVCNGLRVTPIVNEGRLTEAQRRDYDRWLEQQREFAETDALHRAERAMGA